MGTQTQTFTNNTSQTETFYVAVNDVPGQYGDNSGSYMFSDTIMDGTTGCADSQAPACTNATPELGSGELLATGLAPSGPCCSTVGTGRGG